MATRITAYVAHDGKIFTTQKEADAYDGKAIRQIQLTSFLTGKYDKEDIERLYANGTVDFLIDNADELAAALTIQPKRRPRKQKD